MKTDFTGKEINVGDTVVFMKISSRSLGTGKIIELRNKTIIIEHKEIYDTWERKIETKQFHNQVVKI